MTDAEMLDMMGVLIADERLEAFSAAYLELAKGAVIERMFPYTDASWEDVPERFHARTVEIAVYLVNRRGGEGETSHSESGVSRVYESAGIPESYLSGIAPMVGVPS